MNGSKEFAWNALIQRFSWRYVRRRLLSQRVTVLLTLRQSAVTRPTRSVIHISAADHLHLRKWNKDTKTKAAVRFRFFWQDEDVTLTASAVRAEHVCVQMSVQLVLSSPLSQLPVFWCKRLLWSTACRRRSASPRSPLEAPDSGCYQRAAERQGSKVINTAQELKCVK